MTEEELEVLLSQPEIIAWLGQEHLAALLKKKRLEEDDDRGQAARP